MLCHKLLAIAIAPCKSRCQSTEVRHRVDIFIVGHAFSGGALAPEPIAASDRCAGNNWRCSGFKQGNRGAILQNYF